MKYSLGLDIGTTSVGWAVINLDQKRIEDLGVRIFEKPENPKDGKSLAEPRRTARSARRRLNRRRQRLNYLKRFFVENKLLMADEIEKILAPHKGAKDPYELREKGLKEKLENDELFIALYHIAKRRGYKSNRKSIEESDKEAGKVLKSISDNKKLLAKYETVAATLNTDSKFVAHKRNKADDYSNSFIREDFLGEIEKLLKAQGWSDEKINELLWKNYLLEYDVKKKNGQELGADKFKHLKVKMAVGLFAQRPFMDEELIEKMRGKCPFEKNEPRAQKASLTFEMFRLTQDLAHLTYNNGQKLTEDEIKKCIDKCAETQQIKRNGELKDKETQAVTYKMIRESLGYKGNDNFKFDYVRGKVKNGEDSEKNTFAELRFYHAVKKALKDLPTDWKAVENDEELFDEIGYILTVNRDDEAIEAELKKIGKLSEDAINAINSMKETFSGFGHLSIKALKKITPFILQGNTYDKAVELAGYNFGQKLSGDKNRLPPLNEEESHQITNPVVKRAISQTIKVVNAVIRKYGNPARIGIECANDLAKNFKDRDEIKKAQDENAAQNEKIVTRLKNEFSVANPTGLQITKFKFYNEQNGKCPYCGDSLTRSGTPVELFSDEHYGEIDHIIPFSRCGNDGRGNKVLVHNECNQNKRNQTPYETWGADEERWSKIESFVKATYSGKNYHKGLRILAKTPPKEGWNMRALNDTRYITRFMSQFVRKNLKFSDERENGVQKVITPTGGITSYLRRVWRIGTKDRDESNLHHATDAVIAGLVNQGVIQSVSTLNKYYELFDKNGEDTMKDRLTGEVFNRRELKKSREDVLPWDNFGEEVRLRTSQIEDGKNLVEDGKKLDNWRAQFDEIYKEQGDFIKSVKPIFVSRMPKRNGTGQAHKETIRSPKIKDGCQRTVRKRLENIHIKDLENSVLPESDKVLYRQLRKLLKENGDDPKVAFSEAYRGEDGKEKRRPLKIYKGGKNVDKNGQPISPVSTIKVYSNEPSGFMINGGRGFVNNGSMVRLDIYSRKNAKNKIEHFFVPIYAHQVKTGSTKILPTPKGFTNVDETFEKVCSLYPNDYVKCEFCDDVGKLLRVQEGYYSGYDTNTGRMSLVRHSAADKKEDNRLAARSATIINRCDISVLGDNYPWE